MNTLDTLRHLPSLPTSELRNLPAIPAIYFAVRRGGTVLYIGKSRNIAQRWQGQSHHRAAQLIAADTWLLWLVVDPAITDDEFTRLERSFIRRLNPQFNDMPIERAPVVDTRSFTERQAQQWNGVQRLVEECQVIQEQIVLAEDTMERQTAAAGRWLRLYRQGLIDVLNQRQQQQDEAAQRLEAIKAGCEQFLPSVRSTKHAA